MGRTGLQLQAHISDRPIRISKKYQFLLKMFHLLYVQQKNSLLNRTINNFCGKFSLFGVDLICKKN